MARVQLHDLRRTRRAVKAESRLGGESFGFLACSNAHVERDQSLVSFARRARCHLCGLDATPHATDERTSYFRSRGAVGARYHRHRSVASSTSISGVGQIGNERGRGFFVQTVLAVRPQRREVLGCIAQELGCRAFLLYRREQRYGRRKREKRESDVWTRQVQAIGTPESTSMWVHVGDRGADMFPFFQACQATQTHFLVRAGKSRRVQEHEAEISYSLTLARSWPSQASRADASSRQAWQGSALDPAAAFLWSDDAPAPARMSRVQAKTP